MVSFTKILRAADIVSPNFSIQFKDQNKIKTATGGLLSILLFSIFSVAFIFFGKDSFSKSRPLTSFSTQKDEQAKIMIEELPITFHPVKDDGTQLMANEDFIKGFDLRAAIWQFDILKGSMTILPIPVVTCKDAYVNRLTNIAADALVDGLSVCLDYSALLKYKGTEEQTASYIENAYLDNYSAFISFYVDKCDENRRPGCRKHTEKVTNIQLWTYTANSSVNADDFENPLIYSKYSTFAQWSGNFKVRKILSFVRNQLITDKGLIFEDNETKTFNSVHDNRDMYSEYAEETRNIVTINLDVHVFKGVHFRKYTKLQEVLASVGGILKIFAVAFQILAGIVSKYRFYVQLSESIERTSSANKNNYVKAADLNSSGKELEPGIQLKNADTQISFMQFVNGSLGLNSPSKKKIEQTFKKIDLETLMNKVAQLEEILKNSD